MSGFVETDLRSNRDTIPRSMIHSLIGQGVKSVVIQGPYASSFAMNAAYTVAKEYLEKDSIEGFSPVTYLVRRSIDFPLICKEVWNHDENYKSRKKVVDLELADENWDEQILKLINIVHIRSIKDLLSFLLSLHSHHKRPRGALIVDNIELFTMQTSENSTFTNEDTQNIIQILAILEDSGEILRKLGSHSLLVLATINSSLPSSLQGLVKNWYPCVLKITNYTEIRPNDVILANWKVETTWIVSLEEGEKNKKVHFSVVKAETGGDAKIIWCIFNS